jgi:hypothetical protein
MAIRGAKMKTFLLIGTLFLAVCVTPSTMMVNSEGKGMRCATTGCGNVIAMSAGQSTHDRCVEDMRKIGT